MARLKGHNMPLYYFDLKDGTRLRDNSGFHFANDHDAIVHADVIASYFALQNGPDVNGYINIVHEDGRVVGRRALLLKQT